MDFIYLFNLKNTYVYLFGCELSSLGQQELSLGHTVFSCSTWAWLPLDMWDLSSSTRGRTHIPSIVRQTLNHWTSREAQENRFHVKIPTS